MEVLDHLTDMVMKEETVEVLLMDMVEDMAMDMVEDMGVGDSFESIDDEKDILFYV